GADERPGADLPQGHPAHARPHPVLEHEAELLRRLQARAGRRAAGLDQRDGLHDLHRAAGSEDRHGVRLDVPHARLRRPIRILRLRRDRAQVSLPVGDRSVIEVSGLTKSFGALRVLSDISFRADRDEFVTIFGPSGCGKTTVLRILAALETPDAGRVLVDGVDGLARLDDYKKKISIVWQDPRLLPGPPTWGTVAFSLERGTRGRRRPDVLGRASQALELVGLRPFASTLPRQLSGGMRQRVNLARALALDAEIMLMDEPLA